MFLGNDTGGGNKAVDGFYVDDGWSANGPSEMDKDSVDKMGMSAADVQAMISAWSANVAACKEGCTIISFLSFGTFFARGYLFRSC